MPAWNRKSPVARTVSVSVAEVFVFGMPSNTIITAPGQWLASTKRTETPSTTNGLPTSTTRRRSF